VQNRTDAELPPDCEHHGPAVFFMGGIFLARFLRAVFLSTRCPGEMELPKHTFFPEPKAPGLPTSSKPQGLEIGVPNSAQSFFLKKLALTY
jgi:hypothetical protein